MLLLAVPVKHYVPLLTGKLLRPDMPFVDLLRQEIVDQKTMLREMAGIGQRFVRCEIRIFVPEG